MGIPWRRPISLTVILPSAEGKRRFLRLAPRLRLKKRFGKGNFCLGRRFFPFFPCFVGGRRQNGGGLKKGDRIMKNSPCLLWLMLVIVLIGTVRTLPVSGGPLSLFQSASVGGNPSASSSSAAGLGGWKSQLIFPLLCWGAVAEWRRIKERG